MASNSNQMTLEERLVQSIKETQLGALIGDEDAITKLTERAIREALFQPIRTQIGDLWNQRTVEKDNPVVEAAREIAKRAVEQLVAAEVERLKGDPATMEAVRLALVNALPAALNLGTRQLFEDAALSGASTAVERVAEMVRTGAIQRQS